MEPESFFKINKEVLFEKFKDIPTEQLVAEELPELDPELGEPQFTQITDDLALHLVPETGVLTWVKLVGSPAPIDAIVAKFASALADISVEVEGLTELPTGVPSLPEGQIVNSIFSVDISNATDEDLVSAHLTLYVEKAWLDANAVHKWAVQFWRLDEGSNSWVLFQTKRLKEDEEKVFYTVSLPGFSLVAITGGLEIPTQNFEVTDLQLDPASPTADEQVTVRATVANIGAESGTFSVTLYIDSVADSVDVISLESGESGIIEYTTVLDAGARELRADRVTRSIQVASIITPTPVPQEAEETSTAIPEPTAQATPTPTSVPPTPTATVSTATPTPTPAPTATPAAPGEVVSDEDDGGLSAGAVTGIIVGSIFGVIAVAGIAFGVYTRRRQGSSFFETGGTG